MPSFHLHFVGCFVLNDLIRGWVIGPVLVIWIACPGNVSLFMFKLSNYAFREADSIATNSFNGLSSFCFIQTFLFNLTGHFWHIFLLILSSFMKLNTMLCLLSSSCSNHRTSLVVVSSSPPWQCKRLGASPKLHLTPLLLELGALWVQGLLQAHIPTSLLFCSWLIISNIY